MLQLLERLVADGQTHTFSGGPQTSLKTEQQFSHRLEKQYQEPIAEKILYSVPGLFVSPIGQ